MKSTFITIAAILIGFTAKSQVAINTAQAAPDSSAILDVSSTTKGILIPRLTTTQRSNIAAPALSLLVFDTDLKKFVFKSDTGWVIMATSPEVASKIVDADANTKVEVEKNSNENKIRFTLNGVEHFVMNRGTIEVNNTGGATYIGKEAGINENYDAATNNVGIGKQALKASVSGFNNVAVGSRALWSNAGGNDNVAVGTDALRSNDQAANTAIGTLAGAENNGNGNVFVGNGAGQNELGNDKLYISNSNTTTPLIKGDFATKKVIINDSLEAKNIKLTNGAINGHVLQSDANGKATWVNPSTLPVSIVEQDPKIISSTTNTVSKWNGTHLVDGQITDSGTNVGIGVTNPTVKLDVAGSIKASGGIILDTAGLNNSDAVNILRFGSATSGEGIGSSRQITNNNRGLDLYTDHEPRLSIANWGGVGIGTLFPANKLDVNGNLAIGANYAENQNAPTNGAIIQGAVGIGTANPTAKLDVNGNIKGTLITANALQLINGGTTGFVLQSDASGNAFWVNPQFLNVATKTLIADTDANTKVEVEKTANDNRIVFTQDGTEYHRMNKATLEFNNSRSNIFLGNASGLNDPLTTSTDNIGLGGNTLQNITASTGNIAIGKRTLQAAIGGAFNVAIGYETMRSKQNGGENVAIGAQAGLNNITGTRNTFLGMSTGSYNNGSGNVFIGYGAGFTEEGSNKLIIKNTGLAAETPLIEGDFSTKNVKINDTLTVKKIVLPDGAANGSILQSDALGKASWVNSTSLAQNKLQDADNNTTIHVEKNANEDKIRFTLNGTENFVMIGSRLEPRNNGRSTFFGNGAGENDNLNFNENTFLGYTAGQLNVSGVNNVAVGNKALKNNTSGGFNTATGSSTMEHTTTGSFNVAIGTSALRNQTTGSYNSAIGEGSLPALTTGNNNVALGNTAGYTLVTGSNNTFLGQGAGVQTQGSGNVFVGNSAGRNEVGSNKLYIHNNSTSNPLIYGEFDNNLVKINGALNINNAYNLPLNAGTANQVLKTNGDGSTSWSNSQVVMTTTNKVPKWNGAALVDGQIFDNGTAIGIGTATPTALLHLSGGNLKLDRAGFTNGVTRTIEIGGAQSSEGDDIGQINFRNIDNNNGNVEYTAARISSENKGSDDDGDIRFHTSSNGVLGERMVINRDGRVGIGTSVPAQAKVVISGGTNLNINGGYGYLSRTSNGNTSGNTSADFSLFASERIAASEFNAFSDERIKNIKGISNGKEDLETLAKIEITNYTLKDSISKGNNKYKKVIAQQVEKVYPQAVSKLKDVVPDIYKQAEMKNGVIALENNLKVGDKVKIITQKGEEIFEVVASNKNSFTVNANDTQKVFVFGKQVNDFRSVDYEALGTLNISATQELIKQMKLQNIAIQQQQAQIAELKTTIEQLLKNIKPAAVVATNPSN